MIRPLNDWLLVEREPVEASAQPSIIVSVRPEPVRTARVLAKGPGKQFIDKFVPTLVEIGDRVAFFEAATDTLQGRQLNVILEENQELIRETDVLGVLAEGVKVSL